MRVIVRWVLSLLMLGAVTAGAGAAEAADSMSKERAGRYYLDAACESKRAESRFDWQVWLGRKTISHREAQRRLPEIKRLTRGFALAEQEFGNRLKNPPASWPTEVSTPVRRRVVLQNRYVSALLRASRAADAGGWSFWIKTAWRVDFGEHAAIIRERLELPPPGKGCGQSDS